MALKKNPFPEKPFVDREDILSEMTASFTDLNDRTGFALYGNRRIGKTAILKEAEKRLSEHKKVKIVYISVWDLIENTIDEFLEKLISAVLDKFGTVIRLRVKATDLIRSPTTLTKDILRSLSLGIKLQDQVELSISAAADKRININQRVEQAFFLADRLARAKKLKCILMLDEFPSIIHLTNGGKLGLGILRKIRTINENFRNTVLCIAGSIRRTMALAILEPSSAFYRQLTIREIKPLEPSYTKELVESYLQTRIAEEFSQKMQSLTNGIPFYTELLVKSLQRLGGKKLSVDDLEKALENFLAEEGEILFAADLKSMGPKERKIVVSMAVADLTGATRISQATGEKVNSVSKFLRYLEEKGAVYKKEKGVYLLEDPVFQKWLKWKYGS